MYLAYLDDSNRKIKSHNLQVLAAVMINDDLFHRVEIEMGVSILDLVPEDKIEKFQEFHACEVYGGYGVFEGTDQRIRFETIKHLLNVVNTKKLPIIYGAVDVNKLQSKVYGSASPIDIAFRICANGVHDWISANDHAQVALLIADDFADGKVKAGLRKSFRQLRSQIRPPEFPINGSLINLHDDMYFGDSKDSVGLQMADLCSFFIGKHLEGDVASKGFYDLIKDQIFFSSVEPQ